MSEAAAPSVQRAAAANAVANFDRARRDGQMTFGMAAPSPDAAMSIMQRRDLSIRRD